ncbi:MAG: hypothetical protein KC731_30790, partial [Myxococcales bacterium]|nr:hypothetical protein [Myxococcales bacterium]
ETASALAFRQLYFLDAAGNLHPLRFGFQDYTYRRGPPAGTRAGSPPVRAPGKGAHVADGIRLGAGEHPLTALGPRRPAPAKDPNARPTHSLLINAEMLDITDLWWRLHPEEEEERLLHPGLGGRIEHFRILAWASGSLPILWFAAVPDAALTSSDGADIVLFRPPAEANSFTHQPDAKAIAHEHHHKVTLTGKVTTMWMLARFLLAPKTVAQLRKAGVTDPRTIASFADEIQPVAPRSQGKIVPAVPTPFVSGFPVAFRACALERALQQTGVGHVLLLPFASENDGYPGAQQAGLKGIVESAYLCLWNQCAVSRHLPMSRIQPDLDEVRPTPQRPDPRKRKLWVVGHSFGNTMMAAALSSNALDVERAISISPTTATSFVVNNARSAAAARKKNGASLDLFMVTAPDHTKQYLTKTSGSLATSCRGVSMDVKGAQALIRTGARVTFLPAFDAQLAHYTLAPGSAIPPMLRTVLGQWTDDEIATSAKLPAGFNFLFMHEYPMYGGEPARSFFEVALGKPQPLLVEPTTLPP